MICILKETEAFTEVAKEKEKERFNLEILENLMEETVIEIDLIDLMKDNIIIKEEDIDKIITGNIDCLKILLFY